jgi:hypothetical protein
MKFTVSSSLGCSLAVALGFLPITPGFGEIADGTVRIETELSEVKIALNRLVIENEQLRADLSGTEKNLAGMRASLANTSAEAEIFKRQAAELKLRMEALGVNTASGNSARLEQRLLAAVASLQAASLEKRALTEALVRLSESASLFAKASTTVDPQSRLALETEIRNAGAERLASKVTLRWWS